MAADGAAMSDAVAALAGALKAGGFVRGIAQRYGTFNEAYWQQSAEYLLSECRADPAAARAVAASLLTEEDVAAMFWHSGLVRPGRNGERPDTIPEVAATLLANLREGRAP